MLLKQRAEAKSGGKGKGSEESLFRGLKGECAETENRKDPSYDLGACGHKDGSEKLCEGVAKKLGSGSVSTSLQKMAS